MLEEEAPPEEEANPLSNQEDMIDILDSANFNQSVEAAEEVEAADEDAPVEALEEVRVEALEPASVPESSDLPLDQLATENQIEVFILNEIKDAIQIHKLNS